MEVLLLGGSLHAALNDYLTSVGCIRTAADLQCAEASTSFSGFPTRAAASSAVGGSAGGRTTSEGICPSSSEAERQYTESGELMLAHSQYRSSETAVSAVRAWKAYSQQHRGTAGMDADFTRGEHQVVTAVRGADSCTRGADSCSASSVEGPRLELAGGSTPCGLCLAVAGGEGVGSGEKEGGATETGASASGVAPAGTNHADTFARWYASLYDSLVQSLSSTTIASRSTAAAAAVVPGGLPVASPPATAAVASSGRSPISSLGSCSSRGAPAADSPASCLQKATPVAQGRALLSRLLACDSWVLESETARLEEHYTLGKEIGRGHFGVVWECTHVASGEAFACKSLSKSRLHSWEDKEDVRREIEILEQLAGHPNVVSLAGVFEDEGAVHIVTELCGGGELFERLRSKGHYSEARAAEIFCELTDAVVHCHGRGIMHRDLKPENVMLTQEEDATGGGDAYAHAPAEWGGSAAGAGGARARRGNPKIKLLDFGLALHVGPQETARGLAGSPYYIAPEVLIGSYGQPADLWSLGVILYILLSGQAPFWAETDEKILWAVENEPLTFKGRAWRGVSESAKDLVACLLNRDPAQRPPAAEILQHPWFAESFNVPEHVPNPPEIVPGDVPHDVLEGGRLEKNYLHEETAVEAGSSGHSGSSCSASYLTKSRLKEISLVSRVPSLTSTLDHLDSSSSGECSSSGSKAQAHCWSRKLQLQLQQLQQQQEQQEQQEHSAEASELLEPVGWWHLFT
eukprot:jgi/Mesen1/6898/ME000353S05922